MHLELRRPPDPSAGAAGAPPPVHHIISIASSDLGLHDGAGRLAPTGHLDAALDVRRGEHVDVVVVLVGGLLRRRMVQLPGGVVHRRGAAEVIASRAALMGKHEARAEDIDAV